MEGGVDVNILREQKLAQIQEDIDKAFVNRILTTYDPESRSDIEVVKAARGVGKKFDQLDEDDSLECIDIVFPWQAAVNNPHDYRDLLLAAYRKLFKEARIEQDSERINKLVAGNLEHEFQHHIPALGEKDVKVKYGVFFTQDKVDNRLGLTPFVSLSGKVTKKTHYAVNQAPAKPSAVDLAAVG